MKYIFFTLIIAICGVYAYSYASDKELMDTVNSLREKTSSDNNTYQKEAESVYESMKERRALPEVALPPLDIFNKDQANIMQSFGLPEANALIDKEGSCIDPKKLGDYKIYIFISSSVPFVTLKNFMADALRLNDALLVLRGVIGSATYLQPTQDFITQISCGKKLSEIKTQNECNVSRVDINPILFSLFGINQVPAIVYSKLSYQDLMIKANMGETLTDDDYFMISGDIELSYALEKFEAAGAETGGYLKALKGGY